MLLPRILIRDSDDVEPSECIVKWAVGERVGYEIIAKQEEP